MGGLALGSVLAARFRDDIRRPIRVYAAVEAAIAATGLVLCLALPQLEGTLARLSAVAGREARMVRSRCHAPDGADP